MKVGILSDGSDESVKKWMVACDKRGVNYEVIDFLSHDWMQKVMSKPFDFFLARPHGIFEHLKTAYDERLYVLNEVLKMSVFPSYHEVFFYENKRFLSYFLEAKQIPHSKTYVFYDRKEALAYLERAIFPIVAKTNIGASGSGVEVIRGESDAKKYILKAFGRKGIRRKSGPNRVTGSPKKWFIKAINSPDYFVSKVRSYLKVSQSRQRHYLLFQDFVPHDFEWRVAKIGESYFAHKKIKVGDKASGSKGIDYVNPPLELLDFVRYICMSNGFNFMAIDIFEDGQGGYLVNEMQCIFGHEQPYIMQVDGIVGRYVFNNGWCFEAGDYNNNESYDLRLDVAIKLFNNTR